MEYRIKLFEGISKQENINLTVFYTDVLLIEKKFAFETKYIPAKSKYGIVWQPSLAKNLVDFDVAVVMFNIRYISMMMLLFKFSSLKNLKILLWGHGFGKNSRMNSIRYQLAKRSSGLMLYYQGQAESFVKMGFPQKKIFIANNTIDVSNFGRNNKVDRKSIVFVGRLQTRKKLEYVLKAMHVLVDTYPDIKFEIIGDGPNGDQLKQVSYDYSLSKVCVFHGSITDEEKLKLFFDRSLVYVSPGAVGLGVLHAFAYGCPVITFKHDPNHGPEYVNLSHGVNALLINDSVEALTDGIKFFIENSVLAEQFGQNALNTYIEKFTMDRMIASIVTAIKTVSS